MRRPPFSTQSASTEGPLISARQGGGRDPFRPGPRRFSRLRSQTRRAFRPVGFFWPGYPGADVSATWAPKNVAQSPPNGRCGDLPEDRAAQATRYYPHNANDEHRFQIAPFHQTPRDWVVEGAEYRPLRPLTAGGSGTGMSSVTHALTDLARTLIGFPGAANVCAPTGTAASLVGG